MNHLPRVVADYLSLWRDIARFPRQVLLNRSHSVASLAAVTGFCLVDLLTDLPYAAVAFCLSLVMFGPSAAVTCVGSVAHTLWDRGLIWADLDCEWCGDDPDDGDDDEPDADDPDDPHGLIREITEYLRNQPATAR